MVCEPGYQAYQSNELPPLYLFIVASGGTNFVVVVAHTLLGDLSGIKIFDRPMCTPHEIHKTIN